MMTEAELQQFSEDNWKRVDAVKRMYCVWKLREVLVGDLDALRKGFETGDWPMGFHHFSGMAVRNVLRQVMKDDELPEVEYESGHSYRNWDDFYMAALRQAVAPRKGEI